MTLPDFSSRLYYDETSPSGLRHKVGIPIGCHKHLFKIAPHEPAGWKNKLDYWLVSFTTRDYFAHTVILSLHGIEVPEGFMVDHKDGNKDNNTIDNLRVVEQVLNVRNRSLPKNNTSGVMGVFIREVKKVTIAVAEWVSPEGKQGSKAFSTNKYGLLPAFKMACEYRAKMIAEFNQRGAGYTTRHGT